MKRSPLLIILSLTIILLPSCADMGLTRGENPQEGSVRSFRSYDLEKGAFYDCSAELLAAGESCLVYGEVQGGLTSSEARMIAAEFDNRIYGRMRESFGPESDVDSNGKIILLYLDIRDGFSGSGGYVAGYFHSINEFSSLTYANSNGADMLFMDTWPAVPTSAESYATIAHELQHLINFSATYFADGTVQDTWINEGLSTGAEYLYSGKVDQNRVDFYNADPKETILYGNNFFVWKGFWETDPRFADCGTLADYATVNLFFQWLRIHAANGAGVYRDILDSPYRDVRAVSEAAASRIDQGFSDWSELLGTWFLANYYSGIGEEENRDFGYRDYNGQIALLSHGFRTAENQKWPFSPGEGILSTIPEEGSIPPVGGANIKYIGLYNDGTLITSAPYTGDKALVFNINTNNNGEDETGYVTNVALTGDGVPPPELRETYTVDAVLEVPGSRAPADRSAPPPYRMKPVETLELP